MLLKYGLGEEKAIKRIEVAVLVALKNGFRTGDVYYVGTDDCMSNAFYFRCSVDLVQPCPTEQPTCPFCLGLMTSNSRLSSATMYTTTTITTITTTTSTTISTYCVLSLR